MVFTPYYRAEKAQEIASGTGVGLAKAQYVIEQMGGTLKIIETAPNKGTTFALSLRVAEQPTTEAGLEEAMEQGTAFGTGA